MNYVFLKVWLQFVYKNAILLFRISLLKRFIYSRVIHLRFSVVQNSYHAYQELCQDDICSFHEKKLRSSQVIY